MLTKEEAQTIVESAVAVCRREVDHELATLHQQDQLNAWTEERATAIAKQAADMAVKQITDNFYMSVGKKTVATIGAMTVVSIIAFRDYIKRLFGFE